MMHKISRLIHFMIFPLTIILLFLPFFVFAKPAHALTTYFKDDFSNGVNGQTPVQVNPTDYTSSNGYFYVLPDLVYDNTNGLWLNGNTGAGDVLKGTSIHRTYYCAGYTFLRDVTDNHTY